MIKILQLRSLTATPILPIKNSAFKWTYIKDIFNEHDFSKCKNVQSVQRKLFFIITKSRKFSKEIFFAIDNDLKYVKVFDDKNDILKSNEQLISSFIISMEIYFRQNYKKIDLESHKYLRHYLLFQYLINENNKPK